MESSFGKGLIFEDFCPPKSLYLLMMVNSRKLIGLHVSDINVCSTVSGEFTSRTHGTIKSDLEDEYTTIVEQDRGLLCPEDTEGQPVVEE